MNGNEMLRSDNLPAGAGAANYASGASADNSVLSRTDLPASLLRPGRNVVAVEVHQSDGGSSDISFDLTLDGVVDGSGTLNTLDPFFLSGPTVFKARARNGADWSALTEARFLPDVVRATSNHLVISELCYRPADASTPAEQAVSSNRDDFEFLEILNGTGQTVDLTGVRFSTGILFQFADGLLLGGGQRYLVVRNQAAFEARYGKGMPVAGEYDGSLSNDGEELALLDATGGDLRRFTYLDESPWPTGPNRNGYSLVLARPETLPDHRIPSHWRTSAAPGGSPGGADVVRFAGAAGVDANGNGQDDLLDYALGRLLSAPGAGLYSSVESFPGVGGDAEHLVVSYPRNLAAEDAQVVLETADQITGPWRREPRSWVSVREERLSGSVTRQTLRRDPSLDSLSTVYVRLSVSPAP